MMSLILAARPGLSCVVEVHHGRGPLLGDERNNSLTDEHGRAALQRIADYGVPVMLMQRFEDRR